MAWVEGLRREAWGLTREAMSASSPRVALAELDRAYGKWYAYNKVATYLLWRWDVIGDRGRGASADLKQAGAQLQPSSVTFDVSGRRVRTSPGAIAP